MIMKVGAFACFVLLLVGCCSTQSTSPFIKFSIDQQAVYRGRADAIIYPGVISNHAHKVVGGNGWMCEFNDTALECYNRTQASTCTTNTISVDKSGYWNPELYYRWPNNTFSLVHNSRMTISLMGAAGKGNQSHPDIRSFPPGLQMISGYPFRRSYNSSVLSNAALSWKCIGDTTTVVTPGFPTADHVCSRGLVGQIWFPQCWNGVGLLSPEGSLHRHISFPIESVQQGNCPADHPIRVPLMYMEVTWDIASFPHGKGVQPFVLSTGDTTGYALHGGFLMGWNADILQKALKDPSCFGDSTKNGQNTKACKTLAPYIRDVSNVYTCEPLRPLANYEDIGINHLITHLPGCIPITGEGPFSPVCSGAWAQNSTVFAPTRRILLRSKKTGLYVKATTALAPVVATTLQNLTYTHVFDLIPNKNSTAYLRTEVTRNFITSFSQDKPLFPLTTEDQLSDKDAFVVKYYNGNGPSVNGTEVSFRAANRMYVAVQSNGQLWPSATSDNDSTARFIVFDANAGISDTRTLKF